MRDGFGFQDPVLGELTDDWNFQCWRGRIVFGSGDDCDLTLMESEEDGFPDSDPRPSGLARLRAAHGVAESGLVPNAVEAVIAARVARLGWRDGPDRDAWSPIEILVDREDRLWLSIHEGETDEYSLWIIAFGAQDRPVEVRRAPFVAGGAPITECGKTV